VADASGLFAFVPPVFPAGSHEIVLRTIAPDGSRAQSRQSVTVVVAENKTSAPVVALAAPDRPTVVLSQPDAPPAQPSDPVPAAPRPSDAMPSDAMPAAPEPRRLGTEVAGLAGTATGPRLPVRIASVDAEDGGGLFVSGEAAPGASVRLYLNDTMIAPGNADGIGRVSFSIGRGVKPGSYRVRLDDVDPVDGAVKTRAEVLFTMPSTLAAAVPSVPGVEATPGPAPATAVAAASADVATGRTRNSDTVMVPEVNTAIVSRGDSLWRISRRIYGRGMRYTEIYVANQEQIRNPQLIYPGQLFVLPADAAAAQVQ
jgi:nucleoid-associated protein YgaU